MTGMTTTGIVSLWNTTEKPKHSREVLEAHAKLQARFDSAMGKSGGVRGRAGRALIEEEEVARSNLRAFERAHGLTPST
jgi:hypothetical protein